MAIDFDSGFEILFCSDLKYEEMSVEIQFQGEQLAQINMDQGFDDLEVEIFLDCIPEELRAKFLLSDFLEVVKVAKEALSIYL